MAAQTRILIAPVTYCYFRLSVVVAIIWGTFFELVIVKNQDLPLEFRRYLF